MAETDKKYRAGYYYAVEPKVKIKESDKYIHGLTFEVVFRIYDRDGKELLFNEIKEDHIPEVFIHAGSGFLNVDIKELYMPAAFKDTDKKWIGDIKQAHGEYEIIAWQSLPGYYHPYQHKK